MNKQEYTYEYRNADGNELFTDKIVTGPVTLEEARAYVLESINELSSESPCTHILIVDEECNEVERLLVPVTSEEQGTAVLDESERIPPFQGYTGVMNTRYQTWEELFTMWGIPQ